jgi:hypothetical protein
MTFNQIAYALVCLLGGGLFTVFGLALLTGKTNNKRRRDPNFRKRKRITGSIILAIGLIWVAVAVLVCIFRPEIEGGFSFELGR